MFSLLLADSGCQIAGHSLGDALCKPAVSCILNFQLTCFDHGGKEVFDLLDGPKIKCLPNLFCRHPRMLLHKHTKILLCRLYINRLYRALCRGVDDSNERLISIVPTKHVLGTVVFDKKSRKSMRSDPGNQPHIAMKGLFCRAILKMGKKRFNIQTTFRCNGNQYIFMTDLSRLCSSSNTHIVEKQIRLIRIRHLCGFICNVLWIGGPVFFVEQVKIFRIHRHAMTCAGLFPMGCHLSVELGQVCAADSIGGIHHLVGILNQSTHHKAKFHLSRKVGLQFSKDWLCSPAPGADRICEICNDNLILESVYLDFEGEVHSKLAQIKIFIRRQNND